MTLDGKELRITVASFSDALALQTAIGKAIKGGKISLDKAALEGDLLGSEGAFATLADMILSVGTSREVEEALFRCAEKALYGQDKVDREFFEKPENRGLYYPVMVEIVKANVGPFFSKIGLLFGGSGADLTKLLKSKLGSLSS